MPELPEVQTIVDDLRKKIIGRKIVDVWFDTPKIIKKPKPEELRREIKNLIIVDIQRRGKNILLYLNADSYEFKRINVDIGINRQYRHKSAYILLIHQKLTGHLLYGKWGVDKVLKSKSLKVESLIKGALMEKVNNYIHFILYLDNGWQIGLSDLRKFAKIIFGQREEIENLEEIKNLGPDPLELPQKDFVTLLKKRKGKIKQVLMDQNTVAGIGNIYSDEILWQAKIHPFKSADKLTDEELKNLYSSAKNILRKAVKLRGASISDFRDAFGKSGEYAKIRKVYQREGEPCVHCGVIIKKVRIGGRSAHYCPKCQKNVQ